MAKRLGRFPAEQMVLKVTLLGSDPKIWRRVEVHSGLTLHDLHYVIQCLFDWEDSHLYQFHVPPGGKLTRAAMRDAKRYHVMPSDLAFGDEMRREAPADEALIGRIFNDQQRQIVYEYDFGDSWEHLVKLEKRRPGGEQDHVPVCLAGENAAPRDDMGSSATTVGSTRCGTKRATCTRKRSNGSGRVSIPRASICLKRTAACLTPSSRRLRGRAGRGRGAADIEPARGSDADYSL